MVPQGWRKTTLGEVLAPKGYIRGPFGSALRRNELLNAGIPVYEQQHAIYGVRDFRFFINDEKYKEMKLQIYIFNLINFLLQEYLFRLVSMILHSYLKTQDLNLK